MLSEFHDLSQRLSVTYQRGHREDAEPPTDRRSTSIPWCTDGRPLSIVVGAGTDHLELRASRVFPRAFHPDDGRVLRNTRARAASASGCRAARVRQAAASRTAC